MHTAMQNVEIEMV